MLVLSVAASLITTLALPANSTGVVIGALTNGVVRTSAIAALLLIPRSRGALRRLDQARRDAAQQLVDCHHPLGHPAGA